MNQHLSTVVIIAGISPTPYCHPQPFYFELSNFDSTMSSDDLKQLCNARAQQAQPLDSKSVCETVWSWQETVSADAQCSSPALRAASNPRPPPQVADECCQQPAATDAVAATDDVTATDAVAATDVTELPPVKDRLAGIEQRSRRAATDVILAHEATVQPPPSEAPTTQLATPQAALSDVRFEVASRISDGSFL